MIDISMFIRHEGRRQADKHCLQVNFLNNSIGFLSNGVYGSNLPPWPSKPCTLVVHHDLLQHYEPTRSLRLSSSHQLSVTSHNLTFGSRAFRFYAPRVWNSLPVSIRESRSLPTFRRHKDILFSVSLPPFSWPSYLEYLRPCALILLRSGAI